MKKIAIIGSGFSGLSAATYLANEGYEVHVFEKNNDIGGRCRHFKTENGYLFDMGPSWYWMPEIIENYFSDFNTSSKNFYDLKRLDPSFDMVFENNETIAIPSHFDELCRVFENIEKDSSEKLKKFLNEAAFKYKLGMEKLVQKPGLSILEFMDKEVIQGVFKLQVFTSFSKHVRQYFSNPKLIALMEFPVLFLGAMPQDTPALYSLMNYAGLQLGTWYPMGGFGKIIDAMQQVAASKGVIFHTNSAVQKINITHNVASSIVVNNEVIQVDAVIASADYAHVEHDLIEEKYRNYNEAYWDKKTFAPSCLIYYIGINKKIKNLQHHTLFFEEDLYEHSIEIYKTKQWPKKPLFYLCCPSKTDDTVAPAGHENLFLLMPIATGINDTAEIRETYFTMMIKRLEKQTNESIIAHIDYKKSYCINNFIMDYNAYKGNAYGLANTLMQTAILKPKIINKKVKNLLYTGQLTVPGPGVPPSIISGKIAANLLHHYLKNQQ